MYCQKKFFGSLEMSKNPRKSITSSHGKILWDAAMKWHYIGSSSHWELMKALQIGPNGPPVNVKQIEKLKPELFAWGMYWNWQIAYVFQQIMSLYYMQRYS